MHCSASRNAEPVPLPESGPAGPMPALACGPGSEDGKGSKKQEEAAPISMHYTAFRRMNIKHLCFLFV